MPFSPASKRTAHALQLNVEGMCQRHGIDRVGFLTLTFAQHITDAKEAQRRMHSLTTHVLRPRYGQCIRVIERMKSGRIHYHLLVALPDDIRTGVDFDAFAQGDYRTASPALRREWAFWRRTAKLYGFGRTELLPVKSTSEAIGRYVGKYIAKHLDSRQERDKGIRLVTYSGVKVASTRFTWTSVASGTWLWRQKLSAWIHALYQAREIHRPTLEAVRRRFGSRWSYHWRDLIMSFPVETLRCGDLTAHFQQQGDRWGALITEQEGEVCGQLSGCETHADAVEHFRQALKYIYGGSHGHEV